MSLHKTLILDVIPSDMKRSIAEENLEELLELIQTVGGIVVEKIIQKRGRPSAKTFLGSGKIEEAADFAKQQKIDLIIVNGELKPNQYLHLGKLFPEKKVWDRVDLILNIFEKHAGSPEAKLQIKAARLHHDIPKIYARQSTTLFERSGAGIGTRGAGEKGIEEEKRHIRRLIKSTERKLESMQKQQGHQRNSRKNHHFPMIACVGYTNAGKSCLMKCLTKKEVIVRDALFATLETRIGKFWLPEQKREVLLADTIGFLRDLPPKLISSFLATLQEAQEADLLLHIIDGSDPRCLEKIVVVNSILEKLNCQNIPQILVFNKMDRIPAPLKDICFLPLREYPNHKSVCISALKKTGIDDLKKAISEVLPL